MDVRWLRGLCTRPGDGARRASTPPAGEAAEGLSIDRRPARSNADRMGARWSRSGRTRGLCWSQAHAHALDPVVRRFCRVDRALLELLVLTHLPLLYWAGLRSRMGTGH